MSRESKPYYLLGARRLRSVEAQIHAALDRLVARWWVKPIGTSVRASAFDETALALDDSAYHCAGEVDRWLALFVSEQDVRSLAGVWLGCQVAHLSELTRQLERRFFSELFMAVTATSQLPILQGDAEWRDFSRGMVRPGAGVILLELDVGGVELRMLACASWWPQFTEGGEKFNGALVEAAAAMRSCHVRLEARLPAARMALSDVAPLAVGDFVNLQLDLSGQVRLVGTDVDVVLPAVLGQSGGAKAVVLSES